MKINLLKQQEEPLKNTYCIIEPSQNDFYPDSVRTKKISNTLLTADYYELEIGQRFQTSFYGILNGIALISGPRAHFIKIKIHHQEFIVNTHTPYSYMDRFTLIPLYLKVEGEIILECMEKIPDLRQCKLKYEKEKVSLKQFAHEGMRKLLEVEVGKVKPSLSLVGLLVDEDHQE